MLDMNAINAKALRWHILKLLLMAGSIKHPFTEKSLVMALQGIGWPATTNDVRRQLEYLKARGLLEITNQDKDIWSANLTPDGIDIVEGTTALPPYLAKD